MPRAARFAGCERDVRPQLAIDVLESWIDHRQMAVTKLRFGYGRLERLHLFCSGIEPDDLHLRHVAVVDPAFLIDIDLQTALSDLAEPILWNRILDDLAGLQIEFSEELGIKIGVPEVSLPIKHFVMR